MTMVNIMLNVEPADEHYLESSARIRKISRAHILRRAMEFVLKDKMFLSIFDDDDLPSERTQKKRKGRGRTFGSTTKPEDNLFDTTRSYSCPQRKHVRYGVPKSAPLTEDDLRQAVLNTIGELVSEK